jgi:glycerol kinase
MARPPPPEALSPGGPDPDPAILGDQQAATVGQVCFAPGEAKNTYGTGNFMLLNTGTEPVRSSRPADDGGLPDSATSRRSTRWRARSRSPAAAVQWLRDQLGIISDAAEVERLARRSRQRRRLLRPGLLGLFAPYWRSDARGAIVGLSRFNTNAHLSPGRAGGDLLPDQGRRRRDERRRRAELGPLKVDGGVVANEVCMQIQADHPRRGGECKPVVAETTALGAAYAAGLATGFWRTTDELRANWQPRTVAGRRSGRRATQRAGYAGWRKAVERTLDWVPTG